MNTQNFCVNCKHCETHHSMMGRKQHCMYFRDPVTGEGRECGYLRAPFGECGQYGRYFKPRKGDE